MHNGDWVKIITSKKKSPSLHWISTTKTGKARAAIRRYWQTYETQTKSPKKIFQPTLWISLPDRPGVLGQVSTLIGQNKLNITKVEMLNKTKENIVFNFFLETRNLKNFTNLISELKQKEFLFKIIRHQNKKNAFFKRIFKNFKKK